MTGENKKPFDRVVIGGLIVDFNRNIIEGPLGEIRLEPKLSRLLAVLVESAGQLKTRDELIDTVWNGAHGADQSLTNAISQLRKIFAQTGSSELSIATIPKRGYQFNGTVVPAPQAEIGNDRVLNPDVQPSLIPKFGGTKNVSLFAIAVISVAALLVTFIVTAKSYQRTSDSVTVSGEGQFLINIGRPENESNSDSLSFSNSLGRTIEHVFANNFLTAVGGIHDNTASSEFEFIISANITIRDGLITALIDVTQSTSALTVWSLKMERPVSEASLFEDNIAYKLADVMRCALDERERMHPRSDAEVLVIVIQLCDATKSGRANWGPIVELGRKLVDLAPDIAEAHAWYGATMSFRLFYDQSLPQAEANSLHKRALNNLDHALAMNPNNGRALWGMAILRDPTISIAQREAFLRRALDNDPGFYWSRNHMAHLLMSVGRREDAISYYKRFMADFPLDRQRPVFVARQLMALGHVDQARFMIEPLLQKHPDADVVKWNWLIAEFWYGDPDKAAELIERFGYGNGPTDCIKTFLDARIKGEVLSVSEIDERCTRSNLGPLINFYGYFGHIDAVFAELDRDTAQYANPANVWNRQSLFETFMTPVHEDPRFVEFLSEIGLVDYWLATSEWPDFCSEKDYLYNCRELTKLAKQQIEAESAENQTQ